MPTTATSSGDFMINTIFIKTAASIIFTNNEMGIYQGIYRDNFSINKF